MSLDLDKTKSDLTGRLNLVPLQDLSPAVQDYLKAIAKAELSGERATTTSVATELRLSAPSVTAMLKKLAELELVERTPYRVSSSPNPVGGSRWRRSGTIGCWSAISWRRSACRWRQHTPRPIAWSTLPRTWKRESMRHSDSPRAIRTATRFRTQTSASGRSRGSR